MHLVLDVGTRSIVDTGKGPVGFGDRVTHHLLVLYDLGRGEGGIGGRGEAKGDGDRPDSNAVACGCTQGGGEEGQLSQDEDAASAEGPCAWYTERLPGTRAARSTQTTACWEGGSQETSFKIWRIFMASASAFFLSSLRTSRVSGSGCRAYASAKGKRRDMPSQRASTHRSSRCARGYFPPDGCI